MLEAAPYLPILSADLRCHHKGMRRHCAACVGRPRERRVCPENHGKERAGKESLLFIVFLCRMPGMSLKEPQEPQEIIGKTFDCEYKHGFFLLETCFTKQSLNCTLGPMSMFVLQGTEAQGAECPPCICSRMRSPVFLCTDEGSRLHVLKSPCSSLCRTLNNVINVRCT